MLTVGAEVYPRPGVSTRTLLTTPFVITAVAVAPNPPTPTIETNGDEVYPEPPAVTSTLNKEPFTITLADAPVPPPPDISINGLEAASYP